jgi:hypothetical protein
MDKDATVTFRLPEATRDALRRAAEADRRSLSSLAVIVLEGWLEERGILSAPKKQRKPTQRR